ncbi:MAG: cytochrome ubiquinol oxidase subunit I, partial [Candidatus Dormibacteraeota bacterium]|nr:cytochrome ubiquinol oxidase subunit I [Candidatus Dormibacteraeota bacterium]
MTAALGLVVPQQQFPVLGNSLVLGIIFILHIAIAEFSVGAITLAVIMEWRSLKLDRHREARYARGAANSYYLVFSLGATFAVFAVVLLLGLWSNEFGTLANVMLPLFAFAFGLFLLIAPALVWYRNSWGRMEPRRHAALGTVVATLQTLFVFLIVGLDAYLITPFNSGLAATSLNPPYWPLLIHRLIGNVSWTALFSAAWAAWKLRRTANSEERAFQGWASSINLRIGLGAALLMPADGFILVYVISLFQPGFFSQLVAGDSAWMLVLQEIFLGIVLVGGNLALLYEACWSGAAPSVIDRVAIGVSLAGMVIACLPAAVIPSSVIALRYTGLFAAVAVTGVHLYVRWRSPAR